KVVEVEQSTRATPGQPPADRMAAASTALHKPTDGIELVPASATGYSSRRRPLPATTRPTPDLEVGLRPLALRAAEPPSAAGPTPLLVTAAGCGRSTEGLRWSATFAGASLPGPARFTRSATSGSYRHEAT